MRSDKGVNNFSDRSLLKNLGHWLGLLTLAKNKPILHDVSVFIRLGVKHGNNICWASNFFGSFISEF